LAILDRARSIGAQAGAAVGRARSRVYHHVATRPAVSRLYRYGLIARTHNFGYTTWAGVPAMQCVTDLWTLQEEISRLRPGVVIEIGSLRGGSALFLAGLLDALGEGRVLSIDISSPPRTGRWS
jgi:cephalosporin hydroxylase